MSYSVAVVADQIKDIRVSVSFPAVEANLTPLIRTLDMSKFEHGKSKVSSELGHVLCIRLDPALGITPCCQLLVHSEQALALQQAPIVYLAKSVAGSLIVHWHCSIFN